MTLLSGSRLPIARHCGWAFRDDVKYTEAPRLYDNEGGTRSHDAFSSYIDTGVFPPLDPEQRRIADAMRSFWGERRATDVWSSEVAFALHPNEWRARVLGKHINRDYKVEPGEVPATVDYVGSMGGVVVVGDWKPAFDPHVERPQDNLQLLAGAAAAMLTHGSDGAMIELARYSESEVWSEPYLATPMVLMRACAEIADIQKRLPMAEPNPGEHCSYCPALGGCPATNEMMRRALPAAKASWTTEFVSEENDALLVEEIAAVKKQLEAVEKALKERARQSPIHLPGGKLYKLIVSRREGMKKELVMQALGDRFAEVVAVTEYEQFRKVNA